jgi:hypothetical protein
MCVSLFLRNEFRISLDFLLYADCFIPHLFSTVYSEKHATVSKSRQYGMTTGVRDSEEFASEKKCHPGLPVVQ